MNSYSFFLLILCITSTSCANGPYSYHNQPNLSESDTRNSKQHSPPQTITIQGSGTTTYKDKNGKTVTIQRGPNEITVLPINDKINPENQEPDSIENTSAPDFNVHNFKFACSELLTALENNDSNAIEKLEVYISGYFDSVNKTKPIGLEQNIIDFCRVNINSALIKAVKYIANTRYQKQPLKTKKKFVQPTNKNITTDEQKNKSTNKSNKNTEDKFSCEISGDSSSCNTGNGQKVIIDNNQ